MNTNQVRAALDGHLGKMPGLPPALGTSSQNTPGGAYIKIAFLTCASAFGAPGGGAAHGHGIYQVGISAPSSWGAGAGRLADMVVAHLGQKTINGPAKRGRGQGAVVQTLLPLRTEAVAEKGRVCMAVCVPYFCFS
jgi:hypothetical protein